MQIIFHKQKVTEEPMEEDYTIPSVRDELNKTRYALDIAYAGFNNAIEEDLIDFYIFEINALLKRYKFLSDQLSTETVLSEQNLYTQTPVHTLVSQVFG